MSDDFLSHVDAARRNRNKILHYVRKNGRVSRTDIWNNMNISRASVTQIIRQLQEMDLIVETGEKVASGRRMSRNLGFNGNARCLYAFDWTTKLLCLVNIGGEILAKTSLSFPASCTPAAFADVVLTGIRQLSKKHPADPEHLLGLGIALPGLINCRDCTVLYSVELGWRDVDIRQLFSQDFGENIFLERTGNMVALGEYVFGAAQGIEHAALILLENEGIGLSTVVHGSCQHGSNYMYGELGHVKLPDSTICSCGQQGCLEAVVRKHLMHNGGIVDDALLEYISYGVAAAVNIADPGIVLLYGKFVRGLTAAQEEYLLGCIRKKITNIRSRNFHTFIRKDEQFMGIKGISAYVFDNCFPD